MLKLLHNNEHEGGIRMVSQSVCVRMETSFVESTVPCIEVNRKKDIWVLKWHQSTGQNDAPSLCKTHQIIIGGKMTEMLP